MFELSWGGSGRLALTGPDRYRTGMMTGSPNSNPADWRTKPTDRFILRWIKLHLASPISPILARLPGLRPWMLTLFSTALGLLAGVLLACRLGWQAGLVGAVAQVFDGVDGQVARLTGRESPGGAFWDSVLDRYTDGAMVLGSVIYLWRGASSGSWPYLAVLGGLALIGSNLISYSTARASTLGLDLGTPTRVSKGARMSLMILAALATVVWADAPWVAIAGLAVATQVEVIRRLRQVWRQGSDE